MSREEMEKRRLQAAEFLAAGRRQVTVAKMFMVSRTTASRWARMLEDGGVEKLQLRKAKGRPPRLSGDQIEKLRNALVACNGRVKWTTERLKNFIQEQCGVEFHRDHVGRLAYKHDLPVKFQAGRKRNTPAELLLINEPIELQLQQ